MASLQKPRAVIILVKAGAPVDATIEGLAKHMEPGDIIIDGGNEWQGLTLVHFSAQRKHILWDTLGA